MTALCYKGCPSSSYFLVRSYLLPKGAAGASLVSQGGGTGKTDRRENQQRPKLGVCELLKDAVPSHFHHS